MALHKNNTMLLLRGTPEELSGPRAEKVLAVARYANCPIRCQEVQIVLGEKPDLKIITGSVLAKSLVLSLGPNDGDDTSSSDSSNQPQQHPQHEQVHITTSNAMMRAIASLSPSSGLLGNTDAQNAIIDSWLSFVWTSLDVQLHVIYTSKRQHQHRNQETDTSQPPSPSMRWLIPIQQSLHRSLGILNAHLKDKTVMVGNNITLADISLAITLKNATNVCNEDDKLLEDHSNLLKWYKTIESQGILQS